ncbi:MAG: hypothetical protein EB127_16725 [Alphaproteobacteria bacterium]|nr:hypothetical protein [Alphaproteobacteria bacterium]
MGGGLLQLVAYGAQDAYLSGNPQITFWRGLFKRHTNFAMEPFRVNLTGQASWGTKHSAILGRHADLVSACYLEVELDTIDAVTFPIRYGPNDPTLANRNPVQAAYNLLRYVELDIGGQIIDRLYGEWMYIWTLLTHSVDKLAALTAGLYDTGAPSNTCGIDGRPVLGNSYHIPLPFYFARNPSAAVPLIALQYHEVKINIMWNKTEIVQINSSGGAAKSNGPRQANLICDYVYLDVEERRRMAQESHEYLIEQTQYNEDKGVTGAMIRCDLTFNHPVKELVWVVQNSARGSCTLGNAQGNPPNTFDPLNFTENAMYSANLQLNGQDRMQTLYSPYFNAVQVYQHHTGGVNLPGVNTANGGIYCYSFALKPEEHQPSGTCNFSRIDSATLVMTLNGSSAVSLADTQNYDVRVYAINYNILRVMSGMGGLAYSN